MAETRTIHDPFLNEPATISTRLVDRLRGKYAVGPTLENGEHEFGWRHHPVAPIQQEAANRIERLLAAIERMAIGVNHIATYRTDAWPPYGSEPMAALETLGAGQEYDMWCCWSAAMCARDELSANQN